MKDPEVAFKERLESILNLLKHGQYRNCFNIARNLTNFSWIAELKDEVFISEILESIFYQMSSLTNDYNIPTEMKQELEKSLSEKMEVVIKAYEKKEPQELYNCLKEIRYMATYHQLYAWQNYPERIRMSTMQRRILDK